jgi:hypothetical protein
VSLLAFLPLFISPLSLSPSLPPYLHARTGGVLYPSSRGVAAGADGGSAAAVAHADAQAEAAETEASSGGGGVEVGAAALMTKRLRGPPSLMQASQAAPMLSTQSSASRAVWVAR